MGAKTKKTTKASPYSIGQRRDGRYMVQKRGGGFINGEEKIKILAEAGKIKMMKPKPKDEAPADEGTPSETTPAT